MSRFRLTVIPSKRNNGRASPNVLGIIDRKKRDSTTPDGSKKLIAVAVTVSGVMIATAAAAR